jgi:hypothetical protein
MTVPVTGAPGNVGTLLMEALWPPATQDEWPPSTRPRFEPPWAATAWR